MNDKISDLISQMTEIQNGRPWIGSSFKRKMELVKYEDFFRRPIAEMHSVAEILSHLTIWRKETLLKMETGKGSLTDDDPSNWKDLDVLKSMGRTQILNTYEISLKEIQNHLKSKNDGFLEQTYYDTDFKGLYTYAWLLQGMLHHDIYHLGQIGYITKFLNLQTHEKSGNSS